jgi:hypothetical protein
MLIAAVMVVLALLGVVAVAASSFDTAQRETVGAADLVALSAAAIFRDSGGAESEAPCAAARAAAEANSVEVTDCTVAGDAVDYAVSVSVRRRISILAAWTVETQGTSVAGHLQPVG